MKPNGLSYLGTGIKSNPWEIVKVFQHLHLLVLALELDSTPGSHMVQQKRKEKKILLIKQWNEYSQPEALNLTFVVLIELNSLWFSVLKAIKWKKYLLVRLKIEV